MIHRARGSSDELLRIVGEIYEAAGNPERWANCLESIRALFSATAAHLLHHDHRSHEGGITEAAGLDPAAMQAYVEHYHQVDPWATNVRLDSVAVGEAVLGQAIVSHPEMLKTEYYAGLGQRYDLTRCLFGYLEAPSATRSSVLSVNRGDRSNEFGPEDTRLLGILVPHLQRALAMHRRLIKADAHWSAAVEVIDRLSIGIILVDANLNAVFVNRFAELVVRQRDGLTLDGRSVCAATPVLTNRLGQALAAAVAIFTGDSLSGGEEALMVSRPSGRRALQLLVAPASHSHPYAGAAGPVAAILFVNDPEVRPQVEATALREYFGLTPAEARFAVAVASGRQPQEVAEEQRLTRATARWLVEQLRIKTGARTQAQAVAAILQSLAVLRSHHPETKA